MQPDAAIATAWAIYAVILAVPLLTVAAMIAVDAITVPPYRAVLAAGLPPAPPDYTGRRRHP